MKKLLLSLSFYYLFISCSPDCPLPMGEYQGTAILTNDSLCDTFNIILEITSEEYQKGIGISDPLGNSITPFYLNGNLSIESICDLPLERLNSYTGEKDDGTIVVNFMAHDSDEKNPVLISGEGSYVKGKIEGNFGFLPSTYENGEFELFH